MAGGAADQGWIQGWILCPSLSPHIFPFPNPTKHLKEGPLELPHSSLAPGSFFESPSIPLRNFPSNLTSCFIAVRPHSRCSNPRPHTFLSLWPLDIWLNLSQMKATPHLCMELAAGMPELHRLVNVAICIWQRDFFKCRQGKHPLLLNGLRWFFFFFPLTKKKRKKEETYKLFAWKKPFPTEIGHGQGSSWL